MKIIRFSKVVFFIIFPFFNVFALGGCGGGGGGSSTTSTVGTVSGYLYTITSARSVQATPAGYTPLSNANVTCSGISAITNTDGYYELKNVPSGQQTCSASKSGYVAINFSVNVVAGQNNIVNPEGSVSSGVLSPQQIVMQTGVPSLIVVAPHPDDEALGFSGVIYRETQINKRAVAVIIMTNGDAYPTLCSGDAGERMREYGQQFTQETISAMKMLGVPEDHIYLLGFPDGGLESMANGNYSNTPYYSSCTQTNTKYTNNLHQAYNPGESYLGINAVKDLKEIFSSIINVNNPEIYTLSSSDTHPDHYTTNMFVRMALNELNRNDINVHTTIIHWINDQTWPERKCDPNSIDFENCVSTTSFEWPSDMNVDKAKIETVILDEKAIILKKECLNKYVTRSADFGYFMSFVRKDEQFLPSTYQSAMYAEASVNVDGPWSDSVTVGQGATYYIRVSGATPNSTISVRYSGPNNGTYTETSDNAGNVIWPATSDCTGTRPAGTYIISVTNNGETDTIIETRTSSTASCPMPKHH